MENKDTSSSLAIDIMTGVDSSAGSNISNIGSSNNNENNDDSMISSNDNIDTNTTTTNGIHHELLTHNGKTSDSSLDVDLFSGISGGNNGNGAADNAMNVDDNGTISQIVGQLKSSIESSFTSTTPSTFSVHPSSSLITSTNSNNKISDNINNKQMMNDSSKMSSASSSNDTSANVTTNGSLFNDQFDLNSLTNDNIDSTINKNNDNSFNQQSTMLMNHVSSQQSATESKLTNSNLQHQQQQEQFNSIASTSVAATTTTTLGNNVSGGKRILISANSPQPVNSSINDNTTTSANAILTPATTITTKLQMAQKYTPILNLQQQSPQTNGGQQSSMFLQPQQPQIVSSSSASTTATTTIRTNHHQIQMPQVSLSNSIVLDPRTQQSAQLTQHQLTNVSTHNANNPGSNLQFQILNVNNTSRNQITVPTAVSAPAGYAVSNIITGTNATTIQTKTVSPQIQQPRLVQFPNSQVRLPSRGSGFAAPLTLPAGLVRGQPIFVKTENGQLHMVNVNPQALAASPQTVAGHQLPAGAQLRFQVSAATPPRTANVPTTGPNVTIQSPAAIRTQLGGSQLVLPATLATAAGVNTQVPTIPANRVSQLLPQQMITGNVALPATGQITPVISSSAPQSTVTQSSPSSVNVASIVQPTSTTGPHPPLRVQTTAASSPSNSAAPSQMSPSTAKMKCKNFLSTLIRLASEQPESVATNVKTLIQGLIDDTIQPEDFTTQLQRELNSSEQPCLVPFLKKSLPYLRYSLMKEELKIDGVQPPPPTATMAYPSNVHTMALHGSAAASPNLPHIQNISPVPTVSPQPRPSPLPPGVSLIGSGSNLIATGNVPAGAQIIASLQQPTHHQMQPGPGSTSNHHPHQTSQSNSLGPIVLTSPNYHPHGPAISAHQHTNLISMSPNLQTTNTSLHHSRLPPGITQHPSVQSVTPQAPSEQSSMGSAVTTPSMQPTPTKSKKSSSKSETKSKKAKKEKEDKSAFASGPPISSSSTASTTGERSATGGSSFRDDDDINDVAAMGGVNLAEESQRILAGNAEIIGQQIRSCKDEPFLYTSPLQQKLNGIVKRYDLEECSHDVVALVSHAAEERLKTLVERLGAIAEHRQENLRNNPNYEIIQDVKAQAQFLQELDRLEKRRHEEQEREVLMKAAKSRSKVDDPDHIAIKAKAKEMQRLEMEELRQREANKTALQAIGNPKKRLKATVTPAALNSFNSLSDAVNGLGGSNLTTSNNTNTASGNSLNASNVGTTNNPKTNSNKSNKTNADINNLNTFGQSLFGSSFGSSRSTIKRLKRVTMKDIIFMMERDRTLARSKTLFKTYAR